jgi:large-conductance mechanosensitive channel
VEVSGAEACGVAGSGAGSGSVAQAAVLKAKTNVENTIPALLDWIIIAFILFQISKGVQASKSDKLART